MKRYLRILWRFWKNSLIREMTFRTHFVVNAASEVLWIVGVLIFLSVIFSNTAQVKGWSQYQYLFLIGTHMILTSIFEALFFDNCRRFSESIRTGNLDFVLLKPANTQFLLSFERVNYSAFANLPVGIGLCLYAASRSGASVDFADLATFSVLIAAGIVMLYALLFMFSISSVFLIRQTGLESLWFYTTSIARYPAEIYRQFAGGFLWYALVFVIPVLLVVNLPANVVVRSYSTWMIPYMLVSSVALLVLSHLLFRFALRWYRSASS